MITHWQLSMRSCCCPSSLLGISRAAWRHAVAGALSPSGGSHNQQHNLPNAFGLAERFFSSSFSKRFTKKRSAAKKGTLPTRYPCGGEPFYVFRKGGVIGVYKNLADCHAQVSDSVCDPRVPVFRGYALRKKTKEYLAALETCEGLKNALYSIKATEPRDELFGDLAPCHFQIVHCATFGEATSTLKDPQKMETRPSKMHVKVAEQRPLPDSPLSCILEFDGSSEGNPGKSGAGVIVRRPDGSVIAQLREGLGFATYNVASYRALLLGLRYAAENGFKYIHAQGDCDLVCYQAQGLWTPKSANMSDLCKKVEELKGRFLWFQANPVSKKMNADADAQSKAAADLPVGETREQPC